MKKDFIQAGKIIFLGLIISLSVGMLNAQTFLTPSNTPPTDLTNNGNTYPYIHEGIVAQVKKGDLSVMSFLATQNSSVNRKVVVGNDIPVFYQLGQPIPDTLTVFGNKKIAGDVKITGLINSTQKRVCANSIGQLIKCPDLVMPGCGTSYGQVFMNAPTTNLCATGGSPSAVTGVLGGPFNWTCTTPPPLGSTVSCATIPACISGSQIFNTVGSSSWTVPLGCSHIVVTARGGGGGGAGGSNESAFGSQMGGGGGGRGGLGSLDNTYLQLGITSGQVIPITIGAGGAGGANSGSTEDKTGIPGGDAGSTSFGSYLVAPGGKGGGDYGNNINWGGFQGTSGYFGDCPADYYADGKPSTYGNGGNGGGTGCSGVTVLGGPAGFNGDPAEKAGDPGASGPGGNQTGGYGGGGGGGGYGSLHSGGSGGNGGSGWLKVVWN